jgi:hypothetical protein
MDPDFGSSSKTIMLRVFEQSRRSKRFVCGAGMIESFSRKIPQAAIGFFRGNFRHLANKPGIAKIIPGAGKRQLNIFK